jgi:catechol 2,3-dioxygenase
MSSPVTSNLTTQRRIHADTRLGPVHYTVTNLDRQAAFYQDILGFRLHWREDNSAGLGAGGEDLLRLTEVEGAKPARGTTGLYHTAFLVPTRLDQAYLLRSIAVTRTPIQGMTNHGTHLAIYLPDAEGNGIELAWDFPKDQWPTTFEEMMSRHRGLQPEEVFSVLEGQPEEWTALSSGTKVGHVHLHVAYLEPTEAFYKDMLGMDVPFDFPDGSAKFFSAGGYHHHVGTNLWQGVGAPPPPANATGLRYYTIVVPDKAELDAVLERVHAAGVTTEQTAEGYLMRDPAQNGIVLRAEK